MMRVAIVSVDGFAALRVLQKMLCILVSVVVYLLASSAGTRKPFYGSSSDQSSAPSGDLGCDRPAQPL